MRVLSIDLAYKHYRDCGVALLSRHDGALHAQLRVLPLTGTPDPGVLADWLADEADRHQVAGLCVDGPLGWKAPDTDAPHCRLSERAVRAPGKTGLPPDGVKPRGYLPFTQFSIALFERLTGAHGFVLPGHPATSDARFVTETFPTAAWRALRLTPLPGKSRATPTDVGHAVRRLKDATKVALDGTPSHDQLQAVVGGLAPLDWARGARDRVHLAGAPPFRLDDSWREGYIMIPAAAPA
jgi:hypothetical protein